MSKIFIFTFWYLIVYSHSLLKNLDIIKFLFFFFHFGFIFTPISYCIVGN